MAEQNINSSTSSTRVPLEKRISQVLEDRASKYRQLAKALEDNVCKSFTYKPEINRNIDVPSRALQPPQAIERDWHDVPAPQHEPTFQPYITQQAKKLNRDSEPVHERLYRLGTATTPSSAQQKPRPVSPTGDRNSNGILLNNLKTLNNNGSSLKGVAVGTLVNVTNTVGDKNASAEVSQCLYQEAVARKTRHEIRERVAHAHAENQRTVTKLSPTSEELVRQRRDKELKQIWYSFCAQSGDNPEDVPLEDQKINYDQLHSILKQIGFFSSIAQGEASTEQEVRFTDKIWAAMNIDGLPFIQYSDFIRVIGALLEPPPCSNKAGVTGATCDSAPSWATTLGGFEGMTPNGGSTGSLQDTAVTEIAGDGVQIVSETLTLGGGYEAPLHSTYTPTHRSATPPVARKSSEWKTNSKQNSSHRSHSLPRPTTTSQRLSGTKSKQKNKKIATTTPLRQDISFHKLHSTGIGHTRSRNPLKDKNMECTFQPTINPNSKKLEESMVDYGRHAHAQPRYLTLLEKEKQREEKTDMLRKEREQKELEACSFRPKVNRYHGVMGSIGDDVAQGLSREQVLELRFHELFQGKQRAVEKGDPNAATTEEKEVEEYCTFRPNIPKRSLYETNKRAEKRMDTTIAGYADFIRRQKHAQEEKVEKIKQEENMKLGRPPNADPKKWDGTETVKNKQTKVKPFSFQLDKRSRSKPLLYMDINLGPGKTGRLGIHENDSPRQLARNFSASYQLESHLQKKLEILLHQHMEQLIPGFSERYTAQLEREAAEALQLASHTSTSSSSSSSSSSQRGRSKSPIPKHSSTTGSTTTTFMSPRPYTSNSMDGIDINKTDTSMSSASPSVMTNSSIITSPSRDTPSIHGY